MTIQGITVGDVFINPQDKKTKRPSIVIDFSEKKSLLTGKTLELLVIAEKEFLGQKITYEVSLTTVKRNKL